MWKVTIESDSGKPVLERFAYDTRELFEDTLPEMLELINADESVRIEPVFN